jgi:hypothetical protein
VWHSADLLVRGPTFLLTLPVAIVDTKAFLTLLESLASWLLLLTRPAENQDGGISHGCDSCARERFSEEDVQIVIKVSMFSEFS